jgi:hypothetical protein
LVNARCDRAVTRTLLPATASQLLVTVTVASSAGHRVIGCLQKSNSTGGAAQRGFNTEKSEPAF